MIVNRADVLVSVLVNDTFMLKNENTLQIITRYKKIFPEHAYMLNILLLSPFKLAKTSR